nr:beta-ketoacyl synthase N-terminal-like domain-containing protein [Streptomyces fragilis]
MAGQLAAAERARWARSGVEPLTADEGLALLDAALAGPGGALVPVRLDTAALRERAADGVLPAPLRGLVRAPLRQAVVQDATASWAERTAALPRPERENAVADLVLGAAATVLGHATPATIDGTRAFRDLGFDSLTAVELRNRLVAGTGLRLPATAVFDHPSPQALTAFVLSLLPGDQVSPGGAPGPAVAVVAPVADDPIAIVGMACRYPGGVVSPEDLWNLVASGTDAVGPFPADRGWDLAALYDPDPETLGTSYAREGGFLYEAGAVSYTHLDVYKRQDEVCAALDVHLERPLRDVVSARARSWTRRGGRCLLYTSRCV